MNQSEQFGSDKYTVRNVLEIILLLIGLAVVGWFMINTTLFQNALIFWLVGLNAIIFIAAAFLINKTSEIPFNVPISGKPLIPIDKKYLYVIFAIIGFLTFFMLSQTDYRISTPKLQLLDPALEGDIVFAFFAAIFENDFFFVGIAGLVFALVYWKSKNPWLSLLMVMASVPILFTVYHMNVYGLDSVETWAVLIFGVEMTAAMVILRDITYVHVRHVANNIGILIFSVMDAQTLFITLMGNPIFWVIVAVISLYIIWRIIKR